MRRENDRDSGRSIERAGNYKYSRIQPAMPRPISGSHGSGQFSTRSTRSVIELLGIDSYSGNRSVMRHQCEYIQTSNYGTESLSLSRKSEEIESVERIKDPVGCFHAARKERDDTIPTASGDLPISKVRKKKKKRKQKLKKNGQPIKETSETYPGLTEPLPNMDWNLLVQELEFQKQILPLELLIFHVKTLKCLILQCLRFILIWDHFQNSPKRLAKGLVSVTGQTKSGPEPSIQVCSNSIEGDEQVTGDSRPTKRSQVLPSSQEVPMEEEGERDKEEGELKEETKDPETIEQDLETPDIY